MQQNQAQRPMLLNQLDTQKENDEHGYYDL